jgi:lactoylglutathione lyase
VWGRKPNLTAEETVMELGAFSVSLAVKDIHASVAFYGKLGFTEFGGDIAQNWIILKNGDVTIGLFQGMFEGNILTFNPGWKADATPLEHFTDIRELQQSVKSAGLEVVDEADESGSGPASFIVVDPDGNSILLDQHV